MEPLIRRVILADDEYRDGRRDIERQIREQVAERLQELADKRSVAAYWAREGGVSIARIGREGLRTRDHGTAARAIARGAELVARATPDELDEGPVEFEWTPTGTVLVRPHPDAIAPILALVGLEPGDHFAEVSIEDGRVIPVTPGYSPVTGRNPVVALVAGENAEYRQRVLAWAARP